MSDDEDLEDRDDDGDMSGGEEYAELAIDPEDHATLDALNGQNEANAGGRTLADLIFSKMEGGAVSRGIDEDEEGMSTILASRRIRSRHLHLASV
jgi:essential nuclear protein 1